MRQTGERIFQVKGISSAKVVTKRNKVKKFLKAIMSRHNIR